MNRARLALMSSMVVTVTGCTPVQCGPGTELVDNVCRVVAIDAGADIDAGASDAGTWDAGATDAGIADAGENDAGSLDCSTDGVCVPACADDSDCGLAGCDVDFVCNQLCPAGTDADCADPCHLDGVCNSSCGNDLDCQPTPVCAAAVTGEACQAFYGAGGRVGSGCLPAEGACSGYCVCAGSTPTWLCAAAGGASCGGSCPSAVPELGEACPADGTRCSWRATDLLCWETRYCHPIDHVWYPDLAVECECPAAEPTVGSSCSAQMAAWTVGTSCRYTSSPDAGAECRRYVCSGTPEQWSLAPSCP